MSKKEIIIPYKPRPIQKWLHDNLKRYNIIVAHRRFGKSVFGGGELMDKAFANPLPNPTYAFISPTFAMAKRIIWTYMKDFLKDVPGVKFTENDLTITIPRGDRDVVKFYLLSAETPDSIVGIYLDGVIIDEYSLMKGNLFDVVVRPTLSDRNGWVIFTGTVRGRNQFYHHYTKYKLLMEQYPDKYLAVLFKASETGILPKEELLELQSTMSKEAYAQEYECDWGAGDAQTYYGSYIEDLRKRNLITSVPYDPMYPVDLFFDLGMNDMTAIWFRQTIGREFRYINYMQGNGLNIPEWVRRVRDTNYQLGRIVLPHDAAAREYSTGRTRQEAFRASGLITEIQDRQSLQDGIEAVRNHLPKCVFDAVKCADGILCLESYRKKWDDKNSTFMNTPVHDQYSHGADGFRYAALDERPSLKDIQERRRDLPTRVNDRYDIYKKGY